MESHEEISQLVISEFVTVIIVHILGYSIVYIKQCSRYAGCACNDIFAQCPIYVHFARYRNTPGSQPGIDIARHKAKLRLECRPAFSNAACPMLQCVVHQSSNVISYCASLGRIPGSLLPSPNSSPYLYNRRYSWIIFMQVKGFKQVALNSPYFYA